MKKFMLVIIMMSLQLAYSQEENRVKEIKQQKVKSGTSFFIMGLETSTVPFINTVTKDSNQSALYAGINVNYQHSSNLGINIKSYYLLEGSDPGFFLTSITPYYASYKGKILTYLSYTRYITHNNASIPYSPIQNDIYARVTIKTKLLDPVIGANAGFGIDKQDDNNPVSDYNAFAGITRVIYLLNASHKNLLALLPTLQVNAGTDRYFKFSKAAKYISNNRSPRQIGYGRGRRGNNQGNGSVEETYIISEANDFNFSNIELNAYLVYLTGKISIEPSFSLYQPLRGDDTSIYGYWQINMNYWIR